jgi:hypothetical protein
MEGSNTIVRDNIILLKNILLGIAGALVFTGIVLGVYIPYLISRPGLFSPGIIGPTEIMVGIITLYYHLVFATLCFSIANTTFNHSNIKLNIHKVLVIFGYITIGLGISGGIIILIQSRQFGVFLFNPIPFALLMILYNAALGLICLGVPGFYHNSVFNTSGASPQVGRGTPLMGQWMLYGLTGSLADRSIPLGQEALVIGRDARLSNLIIPGNSGHISKRHCQLKLDYQTGSIVLEDLGSRNGTFLASGQRLHQGAPYTLRPGERFYLAEPSLMFELRMG